MIQLFIGSTSRYAGKTMVALGLLDFLIGRGKRAGYFKPVGKNFVMRDGKKVEEDVLLIRERFGLKDDLSLMCPFHLDYQDYIDIVMGKPADAESKITAAYEKIKEGKDALVAGGGADLYDGASVGISNLQFLEKQGIPLLLVDSPAFGEVNLDAIIAMGDRLGPKLRGVILNGLPPERIEFIQKYFVPFLDKKGIKVWGLIPRTPALSSLSIEEIGEALGGEILCCAEKRDETIENFMVGAMNVEGALKYFRAQANKAVITGGDRVDIQLAALETPTRLLILTGGMYPSSSVITAAQEKGVPIMVVGDDTMSVVGKMDFAVRKVNVKGKRIEESIRVFHRYVNPECLGLLEP